ncbi:uncharacterized protein LOC111870865 isoform X3 [Cryptotermes secundus]|uniref:uncharacterized protein LOC111870865 isoform X3 n=1 Tax=Cryptotermes secundus TaxID=105785 RepID=UPI000CD7C67A|nr:uncharacterized protein LOC111870865 isoform X3 [Cryptotermes secundus]
MNSSSMNDGWNSDGESRTEYTPIYSKTFARGGNGRSGATGRDYRNWHGGRNSHTNNYKSEVRESGQGIQGGRFEHNRGQNRDGRNCQEYSSGGRNDREYNSGGRNDCGMGCDRTEVLIKACDVGKIIGKGGTKIRELQNESGAHIQVGKPCDEDFGQTTSVILFGSVDSVAKAKHLIEDFLNNFSTKSDGSGCSGTGGTETAVVEPEPQKPQIDWAKASRIFEEAQKERWSKCPPLRKDFYIEDPEVANMLPEEVQRFRKANNNIVVSYVFDEVESGIPNPVQTFEQCFAHYAEILEEIYKQNFDVPSPIQCQAWPVLLKGHDLIGIAQTGTGTSNVLKQLSEKGLSVSSPSWNDNRTVITNAIAVSANSGQIGAVLDTSCNLAVQFLIWGSLAHIFHKCGIHWLFLYYGNWKYGYFSPINIIHQNNYTSLVTSTVTIALLDCYPVIPLIRGKSLDHLGSESGEPREVTGHWSPGRGLKILSSISNQSEIYDLGGVVLNIASLRSFNAWQSRQMYDWSLFQLLKEILNFRFQVVESRGPFKNSADLWLLKQLMRGQADIGASSILVTHDRVGLVEYTVAVEKFRPQLYYKVQSVRAARNIYILPFSIGVWTSLCSLLLAITVALTFILCRESQLPQQEFGLLINEGKTVDKPVQLKWELSEVLLVTTGAVCQQGSSRNPTTSAARTLFIALFVLAVLTYTAYSASVISLLSSPSSVTSTLQGILRHGSKMGLALLNIHYYHSHFKNEDNAVSRKLHKIEVSPSFLELADGLESTVKGEVAFCADRVDAYTYLHHSQQTEEALCSVGKIPLLQGPEYQRAFALPLSSPFTKPINFGMKLYTQKYKSKQNKGISRQKVMRIMYDTQKRKHTTVVWWISRAWQRFRRSLANAPFPFIH